MTAETKMQSQVELTLFELKPLSEQEYALEVRCAVQGLVAGERVRIDCGAGVVFGMEQDGNQTFVAVYHKAGPYVVVVDVVDGAGAQLAVLSEQPVEIGDMAREQAMSVELVAPAESLTVVGQEATDAEPTPLAAPPEPWLPFRYCRPLWASTRTYRSPGGAVSRTLGAGTYLAIRQETAVGGQLWYYTGERDWIPASSVAHITPSDLRGVELTGAPPPPPPPPGDRKGVVTASVLNVRANPGTGNPVVGTLRAGAEVTIYEERVVAGAAWYRIGENRWVHSGYVRLLPQSAPAGDSALAASASLPLGWSVATNLTVRNRPEATASIVGQLVHYERVSILDSHTAAGATWYRIGDDRWVSATWIGVARQKPRPASIRANERWVGVSLKEQTAIAYEGDKPVFAALVATGLPGTPTVQGVFRTWWRVPSRKMSGPGYYIEEVTWTCYFHGGYALHTAYWHDAFGRPRSHGCVNFSPYDAWWIFQWSAPGGANSPAVYTYWA